MEGIIFLKFKSFKYNDSNPLINQNPHLKFAYRWKESIPKFQGTLNPMFQIPPSRNCLSHSHMDEKNQCKIQNCLDIIIQLHSLKQNPHFTFAYG